MTAVELFPIDDDGRLYISGDLDDWAFIAPHGIDVVIDLDGGLDACIPTETNHCLYIYFPFDDDDRVAAERDEAACGRRTRRVADPGGPSRPGALQHGLQPIGAGGGTDSEVAGDAGRCRRHADT